MKDAKCDVFAILWVGAGSRSVSCWLNSFLLLSSLLKVLGEEVPRPGSTGHLQLALRAVIPAWPVVGSWPFAPPTRAHPALLHICSSLYSCFSLRPLYKCVSFVCWCLPGDHTALAPVQFIHQLAVPKFITNPGATAHCPACFEFCFHLSPS